MKKLSIYYSIVIIALIISLIKPKDYFTWFLEVIPAIVGWIILILTHKRFEFTRFVYILIVIHSLILIVGGHYTYAEVPLFNWIRDYFDLSRNYYDKVGHFFQGFVPALIVRELFLKLKAINKRGWLFFICISICMFISSFYELIEWFMAVVQGQSAEAFLGLQGDEWDAQSDMLMALIGSTLALIIFSRYQDKKIQSLDIKV